MNNLLQNIVSLFSNTHISEEAITEDHSEVKVEVLCVDGKCPMKHEFDVVVASLNIRDSLHISILQNDDVVENYDSATNDVFDTFVSDCQSCLNAGNFKIIVTVVKTVSEQTVSIYYPNHFFHYLSNSNFNNFLAIINKVFNSHRHHTFEVQETSFLEFSTQNIRFVSIDSPQPKAEERDTKNLLKIKNLCHCPFVERYGFVPDDFYPKRTNGSALDGIFSRISLLYSAIFLFDIFNIDGNLVSYRLNGYRTINEEINFTNIDVSSYKTYYQIYRWVYDEGNVVDKIGLARNILSLNFDKANLRLSDTTFEAIKSSYNVYQKENIKQYIDIRNKISDQLIELQNKADRIVDNFVSDYKRSFLAVISFFISVIVIRVISKGDFIGGFNSEVTLLSIGFLCVSLIIMFYARWEIGRQLDRYAEFYHNLKQRHRDLLEESDIDRILNYDADFNSNKRFILKRRKKYTELWSISLGVLFVIAIFLFLINNFDICQLLKALLCCIGNIFH